jgi:ribose/xylose/arabinose/galactoside ABC-type transport system permease subunit
VAPEPSTPLASGARCAQHPEASAVATCTRCGTFLCGACTELLGEAAWCVSCLDFLRRYGPGSRAVVAELVLCLLGLVNGVLLPMLPLFNLLAALGFWVPGRQLRRMARGEVSMRGRTLAQVTRVLAWLNLVLLLAWGTVVGIVVYQRWGR